MLRLRPEDILSRFEDKNGSIDKHERYLLKNYNEGIDEMILLYNEASSSGVIEDEDLEYMADKIHTISYERDRLEFIMGNEIELKPVVKEAVESIRKYQDSLTSQDICTYMIARLKLDYSHFLATQVGWILSSVYEADDGEIFKGIDKRPGSLSVYHLNKEPPKRKLEEVTIKVEAIEKVINRAFSEKEEIRIGIILDNLMRYGYVKSSIPSALDSAICLALISLFGKKSIPLENLGPYNLRSQQALSREEWEKISNLRSYVNPPRKWTAEFYRKQCTVNVI